MILTEALQKYRYNNDLQAENVFRATERALSLLNPGEQITIEDWLLLGSPNILFIGNSNIRTDHLDLREGDYNSIGETMLHPGKSAMIDPFQTVANNSLSKQQKDILIKNGLDRSRGVRRQDNFYITTIPKIESCNYKIYYAPTRGNRLHVRIVHLNHIGAMKNAGPIPLVPESDKINLVKALYKIN